MTILEKKYKDYKWDLLNPCLLKLLIKESNGDLGIFSESIGYDDFGDFMNDIEDFDEKYSESYY